MTWFLNTLVSFFATSILINGPITASPPAPTEWLTSSSGGTLVAVNQTRGTRFDVGGTGFDITALGIYADSGNFTSSITVYLRNSSGTSLGSVSVSMTPRDNTVHYTDLGSPVTVSASTTYYLTCTPNYENLYQNRSYTTTSVATAAGQYYGTLGYENLEFSGTVGFGPMSFKYQ